MFRMRHVVHMMTNAVIVGSLIIFVITMGWVGFLPIFGAIVVGFVLAWPVSILIARWIKTDDPAWNEARNRPVRAEFEERLEHGRDPLRPEPPNPLETTPPR
jgi:hypothetical protein